MAKKPGKGGDVTFLYAILAFLFVVRKKLHIWNPETKLDKIDMFLEESFEFEDLTEFDLVLPDIDLSSGQT